MTDNPEELVKVAASMSAYGRNGSMAAWWKVGHAVQTLAEVAMRDDEVGKAAMAGLQIMAQAYNQEGGKRK